MNKVVHFRILGHIFRMAAMNLYRTYVLGPRQLGYTIKDPVLLASQQDAPAWIGEPSYLRIWEKICRSEILNEHAIMTGRAKCITNCSTDSKQTISAISRSQSIYKIAASSPLIIMSQDS